MRKAIIFFLFFMVTFGGCNKNEAITTKYLDKINIFEQSSLTIMSSNEYGKNVLYIRGFLDKNEADAKTLNNYFKSNNFNIYLLNSNGDKIIIKTYEWNFSKNKNTTEFNLLLYLSESQIKPQVFTNINIGYKEIVKEFSLGDHKIYNEKTSSDDSIITIYSPFTFANPIEYGKSFTLGYQIAVNLKEEYKNIKFYLQVPDDYKDLEIEDINFSYDSSKTEEYRNSSSIIKNNPESYKYFKVYDVNITYKPIIKKNIQIQPLIVAETDNEKLFCKPVTPFNVQFTD